MLRHVHFEQTLFSPGDDEKEARTDLLWLIEALCQRNADFLKQNPSTPRLYKSGVFWEAPKQFEGECYEASVLRKALGGKTKDRDVRRVLDSVQAVFGGEHFCDIGVILELGSIDCDGVAAWRVAELRQAGIAARPYLTWRRSLGGGTTYHALVIWPPFGNVPYETSEDPSLLLGMHQPERSADRAEEIRKNAERCEILLKYGVRPPAQAQLEDVLGLRRRQAVARPTATPAMVADFIRSLDRRAA
jgi:hypothetical protein